MQEEVERLRAKNIEKSCQRVCNFIIFLTFCFSIFSLIFSKDIFFGF